MIYVDTSVILAQLFAEDRVPPAELWDDVLVSSRLSVYETWTRVHARELAASHGEQVRLLFGRIALATYDERLRKAASAMGTAIYPLHQAGPSAAAGLQARPTSS